MMDGQARETMERDFVSPSRYPKYLFLAGYGLLLLCCGFFVGLSLHWPWMNDAQVFHYAIFLMRHGLSPYRQIVDINMPGSYFAEYFGMSVFGSSDISWRLYDFFLITLLISACTYIAPRGYRFGGFVAGVLFTLMHGSEGPWYACERDEIMLVLLLIGYAFTFWSVRRRQPLAMLAAGVALALSASIKPTSILGALALLVLLAMHLRRHHGAVTPYIGYALTGGAMVLGAVVAFLLWRNSLGAFLHRTFTLTAYYTSLDRSPLLYMLKHSLPRGLVLLLPFALVVGWRSRSWRQWEDVALLAGAFFGLLSYFLQDKGYPYHRYPFVGFALLWVGIQLMRGLRETGLGPPVAIAGLVVAVVGIAPFYTLRIRHAEQPDEVSRNIIRDLARLDQRHLQGKVQCLDGIAGCYSALFRLGLVQATGVMGDQLFFQRQPSDVQAKYRAEFLQQITSTPPEAFVETSYTYAGLQSFDKIKAWPQLTDILATKYTLYSEKVFPSYPSEINPIGYRIYLLRH